MSEGFTMTQRQIPTLPALVLLILAIGGCRGADPTVPDFNLEVAIDPASTGTGSIESSDGNIECEPDCDWDYDEGSFITLAAIADLGSLFGGWGGDCSSPVGLQVVELLSDQFCTALFLRGALLSIIEDPAGTGSGTVTGDSIVCGTGGTQCEATFSAGDSANLTVVPDSGSTFAGWGDDCAQFGTLSSIKLEMALDLTCTYRFDDLPDGGDVLTPRGSFTFDHRIEATHLRLGWVWTAGFDDFEGHTVDVTDPDNLTSAAGAEFSSCSGARSLSGFYSPLPQYQEYVIRATCTSSRQGTLTPSSGGFTQVEFYNYAPGEALIRPGLTWEVVADFEFGQLRLIDRDTAPQQDITIPLTNPLERSCPFSLALSASIAYVAGREGTAGTSTANCDNWRGVWRVDLSTQQVLGFTPIGTKLRNIRLFNNFAYVTDFEEDKVHVLNATTGAFDHSISVGDGPTDVLIEDRPGALSDRMYVTNWNTNLVKVFDLTTELELDSQPSGGIAPVRLMWEGNTLLVMNFGDPMVPAGAVLKAFTAQ
jgi:DNA-binding beta-propeller fold protein YncE